MAFSLSLADRVRDALRPLACIEEKKVFGGLGFMCNGNLLLGVWKDDLIARIGPDKKQAALQEPHVRLFDITKRPMKGCVLVQSAGLESNDQLQTWIDRSLEFVSTLPTK